MLSTADTQATVAHLAEQHIRNVQVAGSIPASGSTRGIGAAGSARDWQSRGQGFEPPMLHHNFIFHVAVHATRPHLIYFRMRFFTAPLAVFTNSFCHIAPVLERNDSSKNQLIRHLSFFAILWKGLFSQDLSNRPSVGD